MTNATHQNSFHTAISPILPSRLMTNNPYIAKIPTEDYVVFNTTMVSLVPTAIDYESRHFSTSLHTHQNNHSYNKTPLSPHQNIVSHQRPFQHTTLPPTTTQQYPKTTVNSYIMAYMTRNIRVQTKYCFIHLNNILNITHNLLKKNDSSIKFCDHKSSG